tara:strand:+ start:151 stop:942 length:792 start_codon:yes stop_codon:yes gene_type:complete
MPTFRGSTFANFFNRIFQIDQSSNAGVDATTRAVQTGNGVNTSISLSDDVFQVQPQADDTTATFITKNQGGSNILAVDTTNKRVLCGSSQINALTQYQYFTNSTVTPVAGYHMVLALGTVGQAATEMNEWNLGNGSHPATTLDVSAETYDSHNLVPAYWYLPDAITIMSAHVLMGVSGPTDEALNFHLMSYAMDTFSKNGDLSDGVVIADSGTTSAVDEDVIKIATMTNLPTDVAAGRIILATVESDGTSPVSINMVVKYHIQ